MTTSKPPQKTTTSTVDEPRRHGGTTVRDDAATPVPPPATATATSASSQDADDVPSPPPAPPDDDERLGLLANVVEGGDDYDEYDDNDDYDYDDEDCEVGFVALPSPASFLLARAKANPRLTIATLLMGALTACLVTSDERFRPFAVLLRRFGGDDDDGDCAGVGRDGRGAGGGTPTFPAFPARALLGIEMRGNRSSLSTSSSPTTTAEGPTAGGEGGRDDAVAATSGRERRRRRRRRSPPSPPYDPAADFRYERRGRERILAHWEEVVAAIGRNGDRRGGDDGGGGGGGAGAGPGGPWTGIAAWGPCYPRALRGGDDWPDIVRSNSGRIADGGGVVYPTVESPSRCGGGGWAPSSVGGGGGEDLAGMCRPGFLIIGQGKCGTSSLYHYLTGHPRILPARQKQVDYFRNGRQLNMPPLSWYYSNFPTIESFLGRGALMTGEASPGYMPYPSVVESVVRRLSPTDWRPYGSTLDDRDGPEAWKAQVRSLPKIIAIVRDPVDRARSSYKYNYVEPALSRLRAGRGVTVSGERIPPRMTDGYYRSRHLFSFEELAYAELVALRECLRSGGMGERWTHGELGASPDMFFYESLQRRNGGHRYSRDDAPPLVFLDEACYSDTKHKLVPRVQWEELAAEQPNKTLALPNLHLIQSIVGRGVYALPLEWWYEVFSSNTTAVDNGEEWIHVVCTEFLADDPQRTMADVTRFLGLPYFDFTNVTEVGRYNVDGNQGYDAITKSRDDDETNVDPDSPQPSPHKGSWSADEDAADPLLAISDALMHELDRFYRPFNERLFRLIGKRCPWG